jgi:Sulfite exporter TauE/SafE
MVRSAAQALTDLTALPLAALYLRKLPRHPAREAVRAGYRGPVYGTGWTIVAALLAAFGIAVIATPAGISGAVLLLPFQVSVLGTPSPAVTPTNLLYNIIATPGALYRYRRQHQTGGRLALLLTGGTVPGVIAGSVIRVESWPRS